MSTTTADPDSEFEEKDPPEESPARSIADLRREARDLLTTSIARIPRPSTDAESANGLRWQQALARRAKTTNTEGPNR